MAEITIAGYTFDAPTPYAEGHPLTANEAGVLNQTYHENLRNNFAKKVKDAKDAEGTISDDKLSELSSAFAEYAQSYEFGVRLSGGGGGAAKLDPVEAEARSIAKTMVTQAIREKGGKVKDVDKDRLETAIATLAGREDIVKLAKKRVKERNEVVKGGADVLSDLGLAEAA